MTFVRHKKCHLFYEQCQQMKELEKNFKEFQKIVQNTKRLEIPVLCTPFLGTKQRKFKDFEKVELKYQQKREAIAKQTKLELSWKSSKHKEDDNNLINLQSVEIIVENYSSEESSVSSAMRIGKAAEYVNKKKDIFVDSIEYVPNQRNTLESKNSCAENDLGNNTYADTTEQLLEGDDATDESVETHEGSIDLFIAKDTNHSESNMSCKETDFEKNTDAEAEERSLELETEEEGSIDNQKKATKGIKNVENTKENANSSASILYMFYLYTEIQNSSVRHRWSWPLGIHAYAEGSGDLGEGPKLFKGWV